MIADKDKKTARKFQYKSIDANSLFDKQNIYYDALEAQRILEQIPEIQVPPPQKMQIESPIVKEEKSISLADHFPDKI